MRAKLVQLQQQLALPPPADLIASMGWNDDTILELTIEAGKLYVTPVTDEERKRKFREALESVNQRHDATLRRLVE